MSEHLHKISQLDIERGVDAAWSANEAYRKINTLKGRVLEILQDDQNHLRETSAIAIGLGWVAVSGNPISNHIIGEFSIAVREFNDSEDFADFLIGRDVPGSDTLFASRDSEAEDFMRDRDDPNEPEAR